MKFQGGYLAQTAYVAFGPTELACKKRLNEIPGHGRPHGPAAHTDDVHVVILNLCVANCRFCRNLQFATAASIPPLGLTHPVRGQYLRFAFWKSVQPTACFVRLASKDPEPA